MANCKYGDPTCPCQDGDMCHYEGPNPWPPPKALIDAAPDMLIALEVAWEWFDQRGDGADDASLWQKQALLMAADLGEVLRKAKGEVF